MGPARAQVPLGEPDVPDAGEGTAATQDRLSRQHIVSARHFAQSARDDRCLSAGCAIWALETAQLFCADFCRRMAIPAPPLVGFED